MISFLRWSKLSTLGFRPDDFSNEEEINKELDKYIKAHVLPKPTVLSEDRASASIEYKSRGILLTRAMRFYRRNGFRSTIKATISYIRSFFYGWKKAIFGQKGSSISVYGEKFSQGPWYRIKQEIPRFEFCQEVPTGFREEFDQQIVVIATVLNEAKRLELWVDSLFAQSILPNRLIVIDGGSTDETPFILKKLFNGSAIDLQIEIHPGATPSAGRNIALDKIVNEDQMIIFVDAGCVYDSEYIENLIAPLIINSTEPTAVAGTWIAQSEDHGIQRRLTPEWENFKEKEWQEYLPSARAFALNKKAADLGIRFPEWLQMSGEDTLYMLRVRKAVPRWVIVTKPLVIWNAPDSESSLKSVERRYALGDGESGARDASFWFLRTANLSEYSHVIEGYEEGFMRRPSIDKAHGLSDLWVICSLTGLGDSGGAQRTSQIAIELIRQGKRVVYLSAEKSYEDPDVSIDFEANLERLILAFPEDPIILKLIDAYADLGFKVNILVEAPHPLYLEFIERLKELGVLNLQICYTEIDEWDGILGGKWYDPEVKSQIINQCSVVAASATSLVDDLHLTYGVKVDKIPNAASQHVFYPRELIVKDNLTSRKTITYAGGLWGTWIDWDSIFRAAAVLETHQFYLIGDMDLWRRNLIEARYPNISMPGLVPQKKLPEVYAESHVLVVPFLVNEITRATNPLKIHEYIMMNRPVVCPPLDELKSIENCGHLYFYDPLDPNTYTAAIQKAFSWNGVCEAYVSGDVNNHNGILTWSDVIKRYEKNFENTRQSLS
jgi:glycosyltransferase involved in cell wall biosynthesis